MLEQPEAVGVLWPLTLRPSLGDLGPAGSWWVEAAPSSPGCNPQHPAGAWHSLGAQEGSVSLLVEQGGSLSLLFKNVIF